MVLGGGLGCGAVMRGGGGVVHGAMGCDGVCWVLSGVHGGTFDVVNAPYSADPPPPAPPQKKKKTAFWDFWVSETQQNTGRGAQKPDPGNSQNKFWRCFGAPVQKKQKKNWREFPPGGYPTESRGVRIYMRLSLSINFGPKSLSIDKLLGQKFIERDGCLKSCGWALVSK